MNKSKQSYHNLPFFQEIKITCLKELVFFFVKISHFKSIINDRLFIFIELQFHLMMSFLFDMSFQLFLI